VAAWEIYLVTGNEDWLRLVFPIIRKSIEQDMQNAYDTQTGLVRGESSFLDWREQTYPRWMQPADIYQSMNLGTNAVHYQANIVLANMAKALGDEATALQHEQVASQIRQGMNQHLWMEDKGYYGQFLYGRDYMSLSPKSETLGEALSVLFGVADEGRSKKLVSSMPTVPFGAPCVYPQIPGIPPYHNNAVWPFVQSYWALAAAKAGNDQSFLESMSAVYRQAALFLTNKENFVAENGDYAGTQINSSTMLWSLSGSLGIVYKGLFGMHFEQDRLDFRPFVPEALKGMRTLTGFKYRGSILDIEMTGFGNKIKTFNLDGKPAEATIPAKLKGHHAIKIELASELLPASEVRRVKNATAPATPVVRYENGVIKWNPVAGAAHYQILSKGKIITAINDTTLQVEQALAGNYQVVAVDREEFNSFASEPLAATYPRSAKVYEMENFAKKSALPYSGFGGAGFVRISKTENRNIPCPVTRGEAGLYSVSFRYANGNGPINTENKCAIRTLMLNGKPAGTAVFPQRGVKEWSNWGYSNPIHVQVEKGVNRLELAFLPANENMNEDVNEAMLDLLQVVKLE
jgi:hypothetical protein